MACGDADKSGSGEALAELVELGPQLLGDEVQAVPALRAEAGLVPGAICEARHVEVGTRVVLGTAQGAHAGRR